MSVLLNSWLPMAQRHEGKLCQSRNHIPGTGCASLQNVAQAELPTRNGRFTIYGFKGLGPQDEAVALVRGKLKWQDGAAGARAFAMPDGRCAGIAALRLPRAIRTVAQEDQ